MARVFLKKRWRSRSRGALKRSGSKARKTCGTMEKRTRWSLSPQPTHLAVTAHSEPWCPKWLAKWLVLHDLQVKVIPRVPHALRLEVQLHHHLLRGQALAQAHGHVPGLGHRFNLPSAAQGLLWRWRRWPNEGQLERAGGSRRILALQTALRSLTMAQ